jgi:DNA-binding MarR family transcriptional regulator
MRTGMRDKLDFLSENWRARRPDIDIEPWGIWGRTTRIQEIFASAIAPVLRRHALTFAEYQTLGALVLAGPPYEANPSEIAKFNLLTSGGLANVLVRMEREGLITRTPDPHDGRGVVVRITPRGMENFNAALIDENTVEHDLLKPLNPAERTILTILLRKLLLSIDAENFAEPHPGRPGKAKSPASGSGKRNKPGGKRRADEAAEA